MVARTEIDHLPWSIIYQGQLAKVITLMQSAHYPLKNISAKLEWHYC